MNLKTKILYKGANNPTSDFDILKQNLFSYAKPFKEHKTQLEKGDKIYIFTDGYQDQFGGKRQKIKFKKLILDSNQLSMSQQKDSLENQFNDWRGDLEQIETCVEYKMEIQL